MFEPVIMKEFISDKYISQVTATCSVPLPKKNERGCSHGSFTDASLNHLLRFRVDPDVSRTVDHAIAFYGLREKGQGRRSLICFNCSFIGHVW